MESGDMISARQAFFHEGQLPSAAVRQPVLRSWLRCSDLGLAEQRPPALQPLTDSELRLLHQRHDALRRLCWSPPEPAGADEIAKFLRGRAARPWQIGLLAPRLATALADL